MSDITYAYICNGADPDCKKTACLYQGKGECMHTTNEDYALYKRHDRKYMLEHGVAWEVVE